MTSTRRLHRLRAGLALGAVGALAATGAAQAAPIPAATEASSVAVARTGDDRAAARARLDERLEELTAAGAVGAVAHSRGATGRAWNGAAGVRTIDAARPARPGDTARVASVTKAMVAVLALQEVDRKRWTLETTVDDVWPGLLPGHGDVTLEQLLSHRSGLPDYLVPLLGDAQTGTDLVDVLTRDRTDRQLVRAGLSQPWLFEPGTSFSYSNTNYVVVGLMLQRATHRPVASLLRQRVFRPAGMRDARFPTTGRTFAGPAHLGDYAVLERPYLLDGTSSSVFSSAGAVVASAADIGSFYRSLLAGRLVSKRSLAQMLTPRTTEPLAYGLGVYRATDPCPDASGQPGTLYGHDGASFGTITLVFTSADGTRQASVAFGGRQYTADAPTAAAANRVLVDALVSTCPRPVPAAAAQRSLAELDRLSAGLDTRAEALPEALTTR
ncbi:beta-lactamase family protein [Phycicoccus sp. MAQZ13P-2]|uniref:serine hydrolase domain-containing protein n=1 Tax=Phycicoccus mangrovi TaxID=2840470 RepID=UPI001C000A4F|nr:serine hydrolase domain-containing protein [Phycicoccus mangrovi]MBT9256138.1 beta-lactamase family protein [Phycicoccus mangrovi]MBT9273847.1 beta-lactamase family protein [Phycicoccus mangrovi]